MENTHMASLLLTQSMPSTPEPRCLPFQPPHFHSSLPRPPFPNHTFNHLSPIAGTQAWLLIIFTPLWGPKDPIFPAMRVWKCGRCSQGRESSDLILTVVVDTPSLTMLRPHGPSPWSSTIPHSFLLHSLCTCCSRCLECRTQSSHDRFLLILLFAPTSPSQNNLPWPSPRCTL